jgi:mannose-6-phosphate isomerase-like protein (cupin superfamily)
MGNLSTDLPRIVHFRDRTGYLVHPAFSSGHAHLALGHTALVEPWQDTHLHVHETADELYLLLQGQLILSVSDFAVTLRPFELILVRAGIPHAITGGSGQIEHFGVRAPAVDDKQNRGLLPGPTAFQHYEGDRTITGEWGVRVPLGETGYQNCWLIGFGNALFSSRFMCLAYLDFPTSGMANAGIGTRHQMHFHQESWEYYLVLQGTKRLVLDDELITIETGELLEVPPLTKHMLHSRTAPFQGITLRAPVGMDDKVEIGQESS